MRLMKGDHDSAKLAELQLRFQGIGDGIVWIFLDIVFFSFSDLDS